MVFREIERTSYLDRLLMLRDDDRSVKVIVGVRGCGKSTLLGQYREKLMETGVDESRIVNANLESVRFRDIRDADTLRELLGPSMNPKETNYVLLDEIQHVEGWVTVIEELIGDPHTDVYITGSDMDLLRGKSDSLTGHCIVTEMLPLSFPEYLEKNHCGNDADAGFEEFLVYGGFPGIEVGKGPERCETALKDTLSSILYNGILSEPGIRNVGDVENMIGYLMDSIGKPISTTRISSELRISRPTAEKYLAFLCRISLFRRVDRIDLRTSAVSPSPKYYPVDTGLIGLYLPPEPERKRLETAVFLELERRGYRIQAGSWNSKEVDFVVEKHGQKREYIQVCTGEYNENTKVRELAPLRAVKDSFPKTLMVLFGWPSSFTEDGITVRNVVDWMLGG